MTDIAIIGIGSPHGDDQFGWAVVDELNRSFGIPICEPGIFPEPIPCLPAGLRFEKINNPVDLISALDESERVIIVDAAIGLPAGVWFQSLEFADAADREVIQEIPHHGTHDAGLYMVLRMAESLGKRTDHVRLWIGNAKTFDQLSPMSDELTTAAQQCAAAIAKEWCDARTFAG